MRCTGSEGAGRAILTVTLWCVIYCILCLGGAAYKVMSYFKVSVPCAVPCGLRSLHVLYGGGGGVVESMGLLLVY